MLLLHVRSKKLGNGLKRHLCFIIIRYRSHSSLIQCKNYFRKSATMFSLKIVSVENLYNGNPVVIQ